MKRSAVTIVAFGALAVAAMPSVASAADQGTVRFLHAAPGAPAVDIYVNGNKAVSRLGRGKITQYLDLDSGTYRYAVRAAGAPKRSNNIVLAGSVKVGTDKVATVAVTDRVSGPTLKVRLLSDAAERPFGAAKVRVVHYSADTPAVDVVVKGAGKVVSKLRFPNATPYLTLPQGTYTFFVRPATRLSPSALPGPTLRQHRCSRRISPCHRRRP